MIWIFEECTRVVLVGEGASGVYLGSALRLYIGECSIRWIERDIIIFVFRLAQITSFGSSSRDHRVDETPCDLA